MAVEDEADIAIMLKKGLERCGFSLDAFDNPKTGGFDLFSFPLSGK
jgi:hypothetical protein